MYALIFYISEKEPSKCQAMGKQPRKLRYDASCCENPPPKFNVSWENDPLSNSIVGAVMRIIMAVEVTLRS